MVRRLASLDRRQESCQVGSSSRVTSCHVVLRRLMLLARQELLTRVVDKSR